MARTRPGSFPPCPPTQLCAVRVCSRLRAASSSSQWRGRRTMAQHTSERAAPSQPGLDGDDNL
eukprot:6707948-Prymnesium_polylepis.1